MKCRACARGTLKCRSCDAKLCRAHASKIINQYATCTRCTVSRVDVAITARRRERTAAPQTTGHEQRTVATWNDGLAVKALMSQERRHAYVVDLGDRIVVNIEPPAPIKNGQALRSAR